MWLDASLTWRTLACTLSVRLRWSIRWGCSDLLMGKHRAILPGTCSQQAPSLLGEDPESPPPPPPPTASLADWPSTQRCPYSATRVVILQVLPCITTSNSRLFCAYQMPGQWMRWMNNMPSNLFLYFKIYLWVDQPGKDPDALTLLCSAPNKLARPELNFNVMSSYCTKGCSKKWSLPRGRCWGSSSLHCLMSSGCELMKKNSH